MNTHVAKISPLGFLSDMPFLKRALALAIPVLFQNFLVNFGNLIDTLMVATLDATSVAGVGLANKIFVVFACTGFGLCSGAIILTSQYFGANQIKGIRKTYYLTLFISVLHSLLYIIPATINPSIFIHLFTNDVATMEAGNTYLRIVCLTFLLIAFSQTTTMILRSMNEVNIAVITSVCQLIVNIFFNYALINGHFGFPALGIEGAAIATLISRVVEALIIAIYIIVTKSELIRDVKNSLIYNKEYFKLYFSNVIPTAMNELVWSIGIAAYFIAYGRTSPEALSAITITYTINDLAQAVFIGFCSSCAVIIGQELGHNHLDKARVYARYFNAIFLILVVIIMALLFFGRGIFISIYSNLGEEVCGMLEKCIIVYCIMLVFFNMSFLYIVGILRAGGDAVITIAIDFVTVYFIGFPLALLSCLVWKLPIHLCFLCVSIEEAVKTFWSYMRCREEKWVKNLVQNSK